MSDATRSFRATGLLSEIRGGTELKKTPTRAAAPPPAPSPAATPSPPQTPSRTQSCSSDVDAALMDTVNSMSAGETRSLGSKKVTSPRRGSGAPQLKVQRVKLPKCYGSNMFAVIIDNVLSAEECERLIDMTENTTGLGYDTALLNIGGGRQIEDPSVRKGDRCIVDSVDLARVIFDRIKPHVPATWQHTRSDPEWKLSGLNERLRFLKYGAGDYFRPHYDGCYIRPGGRERSFITLQLYLNTGFDGGQTTIFDSSERETVPVEPLPGRVLMFQHNILHEGTMLRSGHKYAMRTDIMYRR